MVGELFLTVFPPSPLFIVMATIKTKCAECGKEFDKRAADYNRIEREGKRHFCSRSCSVTRGNKEMTDERKEISLKNLTTGKGRPLDEFSPFRYFVNKSICKTRVSKYGTPNISLQYLKSLWESQQGICPYTNIKMILPNGVEEYWKTHSLQKVSLDRIDSANGYIEGNVEFVCFAINLAKNAFTREEMKDFLREIIDAA